MFSEMLIIFLVTSATGVISGLFHVVYKSKCSHVLCCGCLEVERDTKLEIEFDELELKPNANKKER